MLRSRFGPYFKVSSRVLPTWPSAGSRVVQPAMYPSCWRISAMCTLILLCGMDTVSWYAWFAFRNRVSMSAIGSVMVMRAQRPFPPRFPDPWWAWPAAKTRKCERTGGCGGWSPAALRDTGQLAPVRHLADADPAQAERPVDRAGPAAPAAPGVAAHAELRLGCRLVDQSLLRHRWSVLLEREAEPAQQR